MNFVIVKLFSDYVSAHIILGRLQEEGINCWLKDEISGTLAPPFFPYREGIKLMIAEVQVDRALQIINNPI